MKRLRLLLPLTIALLMSMPGSAAVVEDVRFPINLDIFIPCAAEGSGEIVNLTGDLHTVLSATVNGNNVHFNSSVNPQGVSGVGVTTGEKYQGTGVTRSDVNANVQGFPFSIILVDNFRIIGQGPDNNLLVHENFHITVNANGKMTAFFDNFSAECK
jgi:hypothetical protein